ncbi:hypothetical protein BKA67DRAFT_667362 [Truncatella angustata]|uniref:Uncharacterized protein n=1 Tax=Truncatella angustata TaxID=152316 RepID=A0A9P9A3H8_9PEZI|nr:uncharacterized protein BKA67DRAFT_667362 [Truncatella angustata]KAH6660482.1 hypothetical protein BKA67DRAFT_667362 [Truncatella angustata]KAH8201313.1 hypothetical protein TruAng_004557 [Truncatella angustata]
MTAGNPKRVAITTKASESDWFELFRVNYTVINGTGQKVQTSAPSITLIEVIMDSQYLAKLSRRSNTDDGPLDACYFPCNAAFLKGQVDRSREDYCAAGSAFETYWNGCRCCIQGKLDNGYSSENYLAKDFTGQLNICQHDAPPNPANLWGSDPCAFPNTPVATPIPTPFPTQTSWNELAPEDPLSVGFPVTYALNQLRPDHNEKPISVGPSLTATEPKTTLVTETLSETVTNASGSAVVSYITKTFLTTASYATLGPTQDSLAVEPTLSRNVTIGVIAGVVALTALGGGLGLFMWRRTKRKSRQVFQDSYPDSKPSIEAQVSPPTELVGGRMLAHEADGKPIIAELEDTEVKSQPVEDIKSEGKEAEGGNDSDKSAT